jgi:hypothetical protein
MTRISMFMHGHRGGWPVAAAVVSCLACNQSNPADEGKIKTAKEPPPVVKAETRPQPKAASEPVFQAFPCAEDDASDEARLAHKANLLTMPMAVDYVSVRRLGPGLDQTLAERGEPCASGKNVRACKNQLQELVARVGNQDECRGPDCLAITYALVRRGDELSLHSSPAQLQRLFGGLDTPMEAFFVAMASAHLNPAGCDAEFSAYRQVEGGYEIRKREYTKRCQPVELTEFVYRVTAEGAVEELKRKVLKSEPERCIEG